MENNNSYGLFENDESVNSMEELEKLLSGNEDYQNLKEKFGIDLQELDQIFMNISDKKELRYVKISEDVIDPNYVYETDSGFDLCSTENFVIPSLGRYLAPTGLKFDIPKNHEIQIRPKSGLALKLGLTVLNTPGTIDEGYNGEIKVLLYNSSHDPITVSKGMKIAQAVLCPVFNGRQIALKRVEKIEEKDRNDSGFGSTGV
jgi:dUTP pyrophosphatase